MILHCTKLKRATFQTQIRPEITQHVHTHATKNHTRRPPFLRFEPRVCAWHAPAFVAAEPLTKNPPSFHPHSTDEALRLGRRANPRKNFFCQTPVLFTRLTRYAARNHLHVTSTPSTPLISYYLSLGLVPGGLRCLFRRAGSALSAA